MKSVQVCFAITLSFGLSYTLMRLRRSALRRSRQIPERRTVEKLSTFSHYIVFLCFFLSLSFSLFPLFLSPFSFFFQIWDLFSISSSHGAMQENGCFKLVPKRGSLLFVGSSRFQMQMHTATKDATKGLEGIYTAKLRLRRATFRYFASNLPSGLFRTLECFALSWSSILCSRRIAFTYTIVLNKGNFH